MKQDTKTRKASELVPQKLDQGTPYMIAPCFGRRRWRYCSDEQSMELWRKTILLASKICTS